MPIPPPKPPTSSPETFYDLITFGMILASVVILGASLLIMANPQVPFNPLPPPTLPVVVELPSFTPSFTPTFTPSPTHTPSAIPSPTPSATYTPSASPTVTDTPTATPTATLTVTPSPSFTPVLPDLPLATALPTQPSNAPISTEGIPAQTGIVIPTGQAAPAGFGVDSPFPFVALSITQQTNTNAQGCNWSGIAGTVTGLLGEPVLNLPIEVGGEQFLEVRFSGSAPILGASGFEINVGNRPQTETFSVRLLGPTGQALSDYILLETGATCETNLTLIQFQQVNSY